MDLLADLHADNVSPELSRQLWPQVGNDPEALRFLRSLDDVSAELRALAEYPDLVHPMPAEVTARLDRLLDELSGGENPPERVATVHRLPATAPDADEQPADGPAAGTPPPAEPGRFGDRRGRRLRWIVAAAAAAAIVAGSAIAVLAGHGRQVTPNALPTREAETVQLDDNLTAAQVLGAMGRNDVTGPLARPGALHGCVTAAGLDRSVLGSMNVTYGGRPAVLILLTGPRPAKITALVVGNQCGPGDPAVLEIRDIG
jgi:hypothetical protein